MYLAVFHENDTVSNTEHTAYLVGDDDIGHAMFGLQALDEFINTVSRDGVKPGVGLIVAHTLRAHDDGTCQGDTFLHASREIGWHFGSLPREAHNIERFRDLSVDFIDVLDAFLAEWKGDVLSDIERVKQRAVLKHHAHLFTNRAELAFPHIGNIHPVDFDGSLSRLHQPE